jgi:hypothetical protein
MSRFAQLRTRYGLAFVAQPPAMPAPSGPGGGMMFRGGPPDPEMIWGFMGGTGKESINLNERPDIKSRMERSGDPIPPDGILTKAAFKENFAKKMASGGGMGRGGPGGGSFGGGGPGGTSDWVESRFKDSDKNKDGFITIDEASDRLKPIITQADKNGDGKISLDEYKIYMNERMSGGGMGGMTPGAMPPGQVTFSQTPPPGFSPPPAGPESSSSRRDRQVEEDATRVSVSRYGKIPKEVDSWFVECDDDKDGMVGLYEWRNHKKPTAEFLEHDLNADGYLTADEVLRHKRRMIEGLPTLKSVTSSSSGSTPPSSTGSRPSRAGESESTERTKGGKGDRGDRGSRPEKGGKPNPFEVRK